MVANTYNDFRKVIYAPDYHVMPKNIASGDYRAYWDKQNNQLVLFLDSNDEGYVLQIEIDHESGLLMNIQKLKKEVELNNSHLEKLV